MLQQLVLVYETADLDPSHADSGLRRAYVGCAIKLQQSTVVSTISTSHGRDMAIAIVTAGDLRS